MNEHEAQSLVGQHVTVTYVDGHRDRTFLRSVGYSGVTLMKRGTRYTAQLSDIEQIAPRRKTPQEAPTLSVPDVPKGACGLYNGAGDARCMSRKRHGGDHLYMREIGS